MPEGNAKEDTWKCTVRICYDYLIATATATTLELSLQILFLIPGVPTPMFSLAICLQVVGCRGHDFNPEYLAESSHEVRHELGSPVTDHLFRESMQLPNAILK